jgi:hypothetical protein
MFDDFVTQIQSDEIAAIWGLEDEYLGDDE